MGTDDCKHGIVGIEDASSILCCVERVTRSMMRGARVRFMPIVEVEIVQQGSGYKIALVNPQVKTLRPAKGAACNANHMRKRGDVAVLDEGAHALHGRMHQVRARELGKASRLYIGKVAHTPNGNSAAYNHAAAIAKPRYLSMGNGKRVRERPRPRRQLCTRCRSRNADLRYAVRPFGLDGQRGHAVDNFLRAGHHAPFARIPPHGVQEFAR